MKKVLICLLALICLLGLIPATISAGGQWHDLGDGWKIRLDQPAPGDGNKWHVHVQNKNGSQKATENVDGSKHDGDNLDKLPKKVRDKARSSKDYKKGKEMQKKTNAAKTEMKRRKINWNNVASWALVVVVLVLFGLLIYFAGPAAVAFAFA